MTRIFDSVFVTGGSGYVGTVLVPQLLDAGYHVTVYDLMYFGNYLRPHRALKIIGGDIRDRSRLAHYVRWHDAVVHLACISNDASFVLDEKLSTSINMDAFEPVVIASKAAGVQRFIYASSSSVYGVSEAKDVTEDHPLVPLTLYNKYKGLCEPILLNECNQKFTGVVFRPATVCGYSPRMRFDLSVNILTNHAINAGKITVLGGSQMRPNLHIQDYCDVVQLLLTAPASKIQGEIFNVGNENLSIMSIAEMARDIVRLEFARPEEIAIETKPSDDLRSYHINSEKIERVLGFKPSHTVTEAIGNICDAFKKKRFRDTMEDDHYFNVKRLKKLQAV